MLHHPTENQFHVIYQGQHESVYHLLSLLGSVLSLGAKQVIVLAEHLDFPGQKGANGIVLEKEPHVPGVLGKRKYPLDIGRGDTKAKTLEVLAFRSIVNNAVGRADKQVVPSRLIPLSIEQQSGLPFRDKHNGKHLQLDREGGSPTAIHLVKESQFPIVVYHVFQISQAGQVRFFHHPNTL